MNAFEALVHRLSFNYGLLQVGSTDPMTGAHLPRSSRTDVLLELMSTLGPTWDTYQVFHPFINTASGAGWLPTFDARYLVPTLLESPPGDGGAITLIRGWMLQAKAKGSPWPGHARFIGGVDDPTLSRIVELCKASGVSMPAPVESGLYPARLSFPPELLPNFRPIARAFLIGIPASHHRLRALRDQIALDAIAATIADPSLLPGDWAVEMPTAVAPWPGRNNFVGNIDCGLGLYGPSTPTDGEASTNGFYSANLSPNGHAYDTRASDGSGAASNRSVVFGPVDFSQPGASDGAGPPFDYVPSNPGGTPTPPSTYGLRQRGLRLGVRASPSTALHEFGHVFMDALLEWSYLEEEDSLTARVLLEARDRKEQVLSSVPLARRVSADAFFGEFGPERVAVYSEGPHAVVKKESAKGLSLFRVFDLALTSSVIGVLGVGLPTKDVRLVLEQGYTTRDVHEGPRPWPYAMMDSNFGRAENSARYLRQHLRPFFASPSDEKALWGREEFLAELYRMYAESRATLWDRVCLGLAIESQRLSLSPTCRPDGIHHAGDSSSTPGPHDVAVTTGGYHAFGKMVSTSGLLELGFRVVNAAFSVSMARVHEFGADVVGPIGTSPRRDGCWVAAISRRSTGTLTGFRVLLTFVTRSGKRTNERGISLSGAPMSLDVLARDDGGVTLLVLLDSGQLVRTRFAADSSAPVVSDTVKLSSSTSEPTIDITSIRQAFLIPHASPAALMGDELVLVRDAEGRVNVLAEHVDGWRPALARPHDAFGRVDAIAVAPLLLGSELEVGAGRSSGADIKRLVVALFYHLAPNSPAAEFRCLELPAAFELHTGAMDGGLTDLVSAGYYVSGASSILWDGPTTPPPHFAISPTWRSPRMPGKFRAMLSLATRSLYYSPKSVLLFRSDYLYGDGPSHAQFYAIDTWAPESRGDLEEVIDTAVGQHSVLMLMRRVSRGVDYSLVREVFIPPRRRDGVDDETPWWAAVESQASVEEKRLLELLRAPEARAAALPIMHYDHHPVAEHRMFAKGSGGEFGRIARMPTLDSPSTSGDSITFLYAVARGGTCQFALSTDGGWRGDVFEKGATSPDQGVVASDEESIEATLSAEPESSQMAPWFEPFLGG